MALNIEELLQIRDYLNERGLRQPVLSSTAANLAENLIPELGEMYYSTDTESLFFSSSFSTSTSNLVPILKKLKLESKEIKRLQTLLKDKTISKAVLEKTKNEILEKKKNLANSLASDIWKNLDVLMTVGEKRDFIFKGELLAAFIEKKPLKFSFLKGEDPLEGSLFNVWGVKEKEPDIRGAVPRNLAQGSDRDVERTPGDYQDDALKDHSHNYLHFIFNNVHEKIPHWDYFLYPSPPKPSLVETGEAIIDTNYRKSIETRGKNYSVISVLKVLP